MAAAAPAPSETPPNEIFRFKENCENMFITYKEIERIGKKEGNHGSFAIDINRCGPDELCLENSEKKVFDKDTLHTFKVDHFHFDKTNYSNETTNDETGEKALNDLLDLTAKRLNIAPSKALRAAIFHLVQGGYAFGLGITIQSLVSSLSNNLLGYTLPKSNSNEVIREFIISVGDNDNIKVEVTLNYKITDQMLMHISHGFLIKFQAICYLDKSGEISCDSIVISLPDEDPYFINSYYRDFIKLFKIYITDMQSLCDFILVAYGNEEKYQKIRSSEIYSNWTQEQINKFNEVYYFAAIKTNNWNNPEENLEKIRKIFLDAKEILELSVYKKMLDKFIDYMLSFNSKNLYVEHLKTIYAQLKLLLQDKPELFFKFAFLFNAFAQNNYVKAEAIISTIHSSQEYLELLQHDKDILDNALVALGHNSCYKRLAGLTRTNGEQTTLGITFFEGLVKNINSNYLTKDHINNIKDKFKDLKTVLKIAEQKRIYKLLVTNLVTINNDKTDKLTNFLLALYDSIEPILFDNIDLFFNFAFLFNLCATGDYFRFYSTLVGIFKSNNYRSLSKDKKDSIDKVVIKMHALIISDVQDILVPETNEAQKEKKLEIRQKINNRLLNVERITLDDFGLYQDLITQLLIEYQLDQLSIEDQIVQNHLLLFYAACTGEINSYKKIMDNRLLSLHLKRELNEYFLLGFLENAKALQQRKGYIMNYLFPALEDVFNRNSNLLQHLLTLILDFISHGNIISFETFLDHIKDLEKSKVYQKLSKEDKKLLDTEIVKLKILLFPKFTSIVTENLLLIINNFHHPQHCEVMNCSKQIIANPANINNEVIKMELLRLVSESYFADKKDMLKEQLKLITPENQKAYFFNPRFITSEKIIFLIILYNEGLISLDEAQSFVNEITKHRKGKNCVITAEDIAFMVKNDLLNEQSTNDIFSTKFRHAKFWKVITRDTWQTLYTEAKKRCAVVEQNGTLKEVNPNAKKSDFQTLFILEARGRAQGALSMSVSEKLKLLIFAKAKGLFTQNEVMTYVHEMTKRQFKGDYTRITYIDIKFLAENNLIDVETAKNLFSTSWFYDNAWKKITTAQEWQDLHKILRSKTFAGNTPLEVLDQLEERGQATNLLDITYESSNATAMRRLEVDPNAPKPDVTVPTIVPIPQLLPAGAPTREVENPPNIEPIAPLPQPIMNQ